MTLLPIKSFIDVANLRNISGSSLCMRINGRCGSFGSGSPFFAFAFAFLDGRAASRKFHAARAFSNMALFALYFSCSSAYSSSAASMKWSQITGSYDTSNERTSRQTIATLTIIARGPAIAILYASALRLPPAGLPKRGGSVPAQSGDSN